MNAATTWITGAHGFIGRHLSRALAVEGARVAGVGHGAWPEAEAAAWGVAHWLNGDVSASNLGALRAIHGSPERIYHVAGGSSVGAAIAAPHEDFQRTVGSTAELLEWVRQEAPAATLVVVSSAAVYGAGHDGPIAESAEQRPYSPYGHHKAIMEALCRSYGSSYGVKSIIVRLFSVYGSGLRKQLLWDLCSKLDGGAGAPELGGSGDELRDWTDVRDVVRALSIAPGLADSSAPAINAGSGIATPVREVARQVAATWRPHRHLDLPKFSGRSRPGDPLSLVADAGRLRARGFEWRISVSQGIADYVRWFQSRRDAAD